MTLIVHCKLCSGMAASASGLWLLCLSVLLLLDGLYGLSAFGSSLGLFGRRSPILIVFLIDLLGLFRIGSGLGSRFRSSSGSGLGGGLGPFRRRSLVLVVSLSLHRLSGSRVALGSSLGLFSGSSLLTLFLVFLFIDLLELSSLSNSLQTSLGGSLRSGFGRFRRQSFIPIVFCLLSLLRLPGLGGSPSPLSRRSFVILLLGLDLSAATNLGFGNGRLVILVVLHLGLRGLLCRSPCLFGRRLRGRRRGRGLLFILVVCLDLFTLGLAISASLLGFRLVLKESAQYISLTSYSYLFISLFESSPFLGAETDTLLAWFVFLGILQKSAGVKMSERRKEKKRKPTPLKSSGSMCACFTQRSTFPCTSAFCLEPLACAVYRSNGCHTPSPRSRQSPQSPTRRRPCRTARGGAAAARPIRIPCLVSKDV